MTTRSRRTTSCSPSWWTSTRAPDAATQRYGGKESDAPYPVCLSYLWRPHHTERCAIPWSSLGRRDAVAAVHRHAERRPLWRNGGGARRRAGGRSCHIPNGRVFPIRDSAVNRRHFLRNAALVATGAIAADQLDILERLGWTRRMFPSAALGRTTTFSSPSYPFKHSDVGNWISIPGLGNHRYYQILSVTPRGSAIIGDLP
jgi:hypothetical protein